MLRGQTIGGRAAALAMPKRRLRERRLGRSLRADRRANCTPASAGRCTLPTPTGEPRYRIAALTTNLAWSPGVVFMSSGDYARAWGASDAERARGASRGRA